MLHKAIEKCGRPIVLSLSPGPAHIDKAWHYAENANMWRITDDLWDNWKLLKEMFARCEMWQDHVKTGCYPDCDMLPFGYLGKGFGQERQCNLTKDEQRTMMTLWCMFRSPLMLGAELTKLDEWTLSLITDRTLLGMLAEGRRGRQLVHSDELAVWINEPENTSAVDNGTNPDTYIAVFNLKDEDGTIKTDLSEYGMENGKVFTDDIAAHGVVLHIL